MSDAMNRLRPARLWPLLLALAPAFAGASGPEPIGDAAAQWRDFLATADVDAVYGALGEGLGGHSFDAPPTEARCREKAAAIAEAVRQAPVSIAAHYLAFQCAQRLGDEGAAERHVAQVGTLARHALASATEDWMAPPIRVVSGHDIYALLAASGLTFRQEILLPMPLRRHLTYRVIAWDPEAQRERHLYFDFVDTVVRLSHRNQALKFPSGRQRQIEATIDALVRANSLAGLDLKLTLDARKKGDPREIVAGLRPIAERGGYNAAFNWLYHCRHTPFEGCGEGLVDTLLPDAEARHVLPTILLALAYAEGVGVARDTKAAMTLVDAAADQLDDGLATIEFVRAHRNLEVGPLPAFVLERLQALSAKGQPLATALLGYEALGVPGAESLPEALVPALEAAGRRGSMAAMRLLGVEWNNTGQHARALPWLRLAAEAGDAASQDGYGVILYFGQGGVVPDQEQARRWWHEAGHGGDTPAMLRSGWQAMLREDWKSAFDWYASASQMGDDRGTLAAAALLERDLEGLEGGPARALEIYDSMQHGESQAEARRRMALLYIEGKGTEKDLARARALLEQDAETGDHESQARLGILLLEGSLGDADPVQGKAWMQRAMAEGDGGAHDTYAMYLYYQVGTLEARREAMALWAEATEKPGGWGLNNAAWVKCVSPVDELRLPAEGLALARRMGEPATLSAFRLDTLAACHAATGDFEAATLRQQAAVDWMDENDAADPSIEGMRERLLLYRARKAYIEPDSSSEDAGTDAVAE